MKVSISNTNEAVVLTESPFRLVKNIDLSGLQGNHVFAETNQDGSLHISSKYAQRDISIEGIILNNGNDKGGMQGFKNQLYRILNPRNKITITFEDGDDVYFLEGYPISFPVYDVTTRYDFQRFLCQITCSNPYLYRETKVVTFAEVIPSFSFPLEMNNAEIGEKQNTLIQNIYNNGMMDCSADITMTIGAGGTVVNPYLLNLDTREQVKINATLLEGDTVLIRTGVEKEVSLIRNGVKSVFFYALDLSSSFIQLHQGDNTYRFGADSGETYLQIEVAYQERLGGL